MIANKQISWIQLCLYTNPTVAIVVDMITVKEDMITVTIMDMVIAMDMDTVMVMDIATDIHMHLKDQTHKYREIQ